MLQYKFEIERLNDQNRNSNDKNIYLSDKNMYLNNKNRNLNAKNNYLNTKNRRLIAKNKHLKSANNHFIKKIKYLEENINKLNYDMERMKKIYDEKNRRNIAKLFKKDEEIENLRRIIENLERRYKFKYKNRNR